MKWIVQGTKTKTGAKGRWTVEAPNRVDAELRATEAGVEVEDVRPAPNGKPAGNDAEPDAASVVPAPASPMPVPKHTSGGWLTGRALALAGVCLLIGLGAGFLLGRAESPHGQAGQAPGQASSSTNAGHSTSVKPDLIALLGLPASSKDKGMDSLGRHWFDVPSRSSNASAGAVEHWAYEPKTGNLFRETRDATGKTTLAFVRRASAETPDPVVSLLALGPEVMDNGTDPLGRRWFKVPTTQPSTETGKPQVEDWCYDPKTGDLYRQTTVPNEEPKLELLRQVQPEGSEQTPTSNK